MQVLIFFEPVAKTTAGIRNKVVVEIFKEIEKGKFAVA